MSQSDIASIKISIDEVNLIINNFLLDMNNGLINDLSGLDDTVVSLCTQISALPKTSLEPIREDFESMLAKVKELKVFLSEELESTSNRIKTVNTSIAAAKRYTSAANDNN